MLYLNFVWTHILALPLQHYILFLSPEVKVLISPEKFLKINHMYTDVNISLCFKEPTLIWMSNRKLEGMEEQRHATSKL